MNKTYLVAETVSQLKYNQLSFLVADDFSSFRSAVSRMLADLGVVDIDLASDADEIIAKCQAKTYDLVLCDYNLGGGRNGQHVLEELRHKKLLARKAAFVMVSAEANRNVVMCAYDCAPDDYLMKPITTQMLHNRIDRLLHARSAMRPVFHALEESDEYRAMDLLIDMVLAEDRHSTAAQKVLGELFLKNKEYKKAEKLYRQVLEVRELDWARLGLALAKHHQGHLEEAGRWLDKIIEDSYLFLPAYDALAKNWQERGDTEKAQMTVQKSVDVSPMSILRQKALSELALVNDDLETGIEALRRVVKLGRFSCYGVFDDKLRLASAVSRGVESGHSLPMSVVNEVSEHLQSAEDGEGFDDASTVQLAHALYVSSRLNSIRGSKAKALEKIDRAEHLLSIESTNIDVEVDHIHALIGAGLQGKTNRLLSELQNIYKDDQDALERLDEFFDEPISDVNKAMVADINRDGISLYNDGEYDEALSCFDKAMSVFPNHIGLQLNVLQALIGKVKSDPGAPDTQMECRKFVENIASTIEPQNAQYKRFLQLKNMVKNLQDVI